MTPHPATLTYVKNLHPVLEEDDGRLLCVGPGGITWLKSDPTGSYAIDRVLDRRLPDCTALCLGRSAQSLFLDLWEDKGASVAIVPLGP